MGRTTIAMVLLFSALAAGVWILQTKNPAPAEGAPTYVLEINEGDVARIDVLTPAGATAFERLEPFGWKFADSGQPSDFNRVSSVVNRLSKMRSQAKVQDKVTDLALYKLDQPSVAATLTMKDGVTRRILFGSKTVNDAAYYVMVEDIGALFTVSTLIVSDAEKLVSDPPVPTPTPGTPTPATQVAQTPTQTVQTAAPTPQTPTPQVTPAGTLTPTVGLPVPYVS